MLRSSASKRSAATTLRSQRRSSSRRSRQSDQGGRKIFLAAIDHLFAIAAARGPPLQAIPTAEEFLAAVELDMAALLIKKTRSKSKTKAGGAHRSREPNRALHAIAQRILGAAVGTFDTPCNRVMSYISIALYAVMLYSFSEAAVEVSALGPQLTCLEVLGAALSHPTYTLAPHTPTRWFFRRYIPALESHANTIIAKIQTRFDEVANQNTDALADYGVCRPSAIGAMAYSGLQAVFTSISYTLLIVQPIACLLYRAGVTSCRDLCNILGQLTGSLGPVTA